MSDPKKTAVCFIKHWSGFNPKEVACFPAGQAKKLVDGGVAEEVGATAAGRGKTKTAAGDGQRVKAAKQDDVADPAKPQLPAGAGEGAGEGGPPADDDDRP